MKSNQIPFPFRVPLRRGIDALNDDFIVLNDQ
jgi:hypothetical protein